MSLLASGTALLAVAATLIAGCGDSASSPTSDPQVNFNVATRGVVAAQSAIATAAVVAPETITDGTNTLVFDQVDLVLREIELKRSEATTDCGESPKDDACEKLELGPIVVSLPLGAGGVARVFSVTVAPGTYREVEFKIQRVSVSGSYNGVPFAFAHDLNAKEEIHLDPPLVVTESAATELTLFVALDSWFRDGAGLLIDPATAAGGGANELVVTENIRRTLNAFEDHDHNGEDDHGGHHQNGDNNGDNGNFGDDNGDGQHGGHDDGPNHT